MFQSETQLEYTTVHSCSVVNILHVLLVQITTVIWNLDNSIPLRKYTYLHIISLTIFHLCLSLLNWKCLIKFNISGCVLWNPWDITTAHTQTMATPDITGDKTHKHSRGKHGKKFLHTLNFHQWFGGFWWSLTDEIMFKESATYLNLNTLDKSSSTQQMKHGKHEDWQSTHC